MKVCPTHLEELWAKIKEAASDFGEPYTERNCPSSPVIFLVTTSVSAGIGMIALIKPLGPLSPFLCTGVCAEKQLPLCPQELPWHHLTCTPKSRWTTMLLPMDPVQISKDRTHTMHFILLQPRQPKCYSKIGHTPPARSSISGLTWEHQEEHD